MGSGVRLTVESILRFGAKGGLKVAPCAVTGKWQWTLFDGAQQELAFSSRSYSRPSDARRGARRALQALKSLRPRL